MSEKGATWLFCVTCFVGDRAVFVMEAAGVGEVVVKWVKTDVNYLWTTSYGFVFLLDCFYCVVDIFHATNTCL